MSLDSFVWAHCLVSSRAIGLIPAEHAAEGAGAGAGGGGAMAERCMLPAIDLCNHAGEPSSMLAWLKDARGAPPSTTS